MTTTEFFMMIKPDGVRRGLAGEIISRFERKGFTLKEMVMKTITADEARKLYEKYADDHFFNDLIHFTVSGRVILMMWHGSIDSARRMIGHTLVGEGELSKYIGSIRGDYACGVPENLIHTSSSLEDAGRELEIFF